MMFRSKLFVPGSRPEFFDKAFASQADAISFDLEDGVAKDRKDSARATLAAYLNTRRDPSKVVIVRVNAVGTPEFERDMCALARANIDMINLPMVEDERDIAVAAKLLAEFDQVRTLPAAVSLLVNIETPKSLRRAAALAAAHGRVAGLCIGYADLLEPLGIDRRDEGALAFIRTSVVFAAAEVKLPAYDGVFAAVKDPEGYRAECESARRSGLAGKSCIHPSQVSTANTAFSYTAAQIDRARKIVAAADQADAAGIGAYMVDGDMVDAPFANRARALLASLGEGR